MGTLFVLVSPCFRENVVVTCKIGSFLCSLDDLLQKNAFKFFFWKSNVKMAFIWKNVILDLLFAFIKHCWFTRKKKKKEKEKEKRKKKKKKNLTKYYASDYFKVNRFVMNVNCYFIVYFSLKSFYPHFHVIWNMLKCNFVFCGIRLSTFFHDAVRILASPESIAGGAPNCKTGDRGRR